MNLDPNEIADVIEGMIQKSVDKPMNRTFKRGVVASVSGGQVASVYIEGNSVATSGIVCLASYTPVVGDTVLLISIGDTGANTIIAGKIDRTSPHMPHYGSLFFASQNGFVFGNTEVTVPFDATDPNNYGITSTTGSGAYLTVTRAGVYQIHFNYYCKDVATSTLIVWLGISTNGGSSYYRHRIEPRASIQMGTGEVYSMTTRLPAYARVRIDVYNGAGSTRAGAPDDSFDGRNFSGTRLTVVEFR